MQPLFYVNSHTYSNGTLSHFITWRSPRGLIVVYNTLNLSIAQRGAALCNKLIGPEVNNFPARVLRKIRALS